MRSPQKPKRVLKFYHLLCLFTLPCLLFFIYKQCEPPNDKSLENLAEPEVQDRYLATNHQIKTTLAWQPYFLPNTLVYVDGLSKTKHGYEYGTILAVDKTAEYGYPRSRWVKLAPDKTAVIPISDLRPWPNELCFNNIPIHMDASETMEWTMGNNLVEIVKDDELIEFIQQLTGWFGDFALGSKMKCTDCDGTGCDSTENSDPCEKCEGSGSLHSFQEFLKSQLKEKLQTYIVKKWKHFGLEKITPGPGSNMWIPRYPDNNLHNNNRYYHKAHLDDADLGIYPDEIIVSFWIPLKIETNSLLLWRGDGKQLDLTAKKKHETYKYYFKHGSWCLFNDLENAALMIVSNAVPHCGFQFEKQKPNKRFSLDFHLKFHYPGGVKAFRENSKKKEMQKHPSLISEIKKSFPSITFEIIFLFLKLLITFLFPK